MLSPTVKDQELITQESTRVTYWEGSVKVEGKYQGQRVRGMGYVELTGYAKPFLKRNLRSSSLQLQLRIFLSL